MITVYDDKKGKHMSFEADLSKSLQDTIDVQTGYGETQEEAIENLRTQVASVIQRLQSINYTQIEIIKSKY